MGQEIKSYKDLIGWQKAMDLVIAVYSITKKFPSEEKFGLISQMNRSAVSIPSNIAEGWGRESTGNYLQFLRNSRASAMELETQLIISYKLGYIDKISFEEFENKINEVSRIIQGIIRSLNSKFITNLIVICLVDIRYSLFA